VHYDFVQIRSHAIVILGKVELSTHAFTRVHGGMSPWCTMRAHGNNEIILVRIMK
jgi:hypothetical protein